MTEPSHESAELVYRIRNRFMTADEAAAEIDALTEQRVALAVAKCFRATGLRDGETWSRDALWAAKEIRNRMAEAVDRPAPEGAAPTGEIPGCEDWEAQFVAEGRCSTPSQEDEATRQKRSRDAQSQQGLAPSVFERPPSSTQPGCGMGWLPIDTYPREWEPGAETWWGSNVLLFVPTGEVAAASDYRILTGRLEADAWLGWGDDGSMYDISGKPTHWQRLPSPPNVSSSLSSASNTDPSPQTKAAPSQEDTSPVSGPMVERVAAALDATPNLFLRVNKGRADGYPHEICWPGEPIVVIAAYRDRPEAVSRRGQLQLRAYASAAIAVMSSAPTDAGGPGSASNTDVAQESFQCPSCHWHHGHDPAEWFTEEAKLRGFLELVKRERVPFVVNEEVAESSPTQTVGPPGPTAGNVGRAREVVEDWQKAVSPEGWLDTEFDELRKMIATALYDHAYAACAELLAQIREPTKAVVECVATKLERTFARSAYDKSIVVLRALADKLTEPNNAKS